MGSQYKRFGPWLRQKRIERGYSLRKFAQWVGVSPTYLSLVEQGNLQPPTADRVKRMAELRAKTPMSGSPWRAECRRICRKSSKDTHDKFWNFCAKLAA